MTTRPFLESLGDTISKRGRLTFHTPAMGWTVGLGDGSFFQIGPASRETLKHAAHLLPEDHRGDWLTLYPPEGPSKLQVFAKFRDKQHACDFAKALSLILSRDMPTTFDP